MTDIECPQCGHHALSVATRCPRCGHEFSADLLQPLPQVPDRRWLKPVLGAGGVLAVVALLALLGRVGGETGRAGRTANGLGAGSGGGPAVPPAAAGEPTPVPAESASRTTPPPPAEPAPAPASAADLTAPLRRYATNWINVRRRRGLEAPAISVLEPGDAVLVDSLVRGWYRVIVDGRTLGYAHRRYLAAAPPDVTQSP